MRPEYERHPFNRSDEIGGIFERVPTQMTAVIRHLERQDPSRIITRPALHPVDFESPRLVFQLPVRDNIRRLIEVGRKKEHDIFEVWAKAHRILHPDTMRGKANEGDGLVVKINEITSVSQNHEIYSSLLHAFTQVSEWQPAT
jgi:hypothetical protein